MAENPVPVCATADIPSGSVKSFDVGDERIAIYNIEGTFYATEAHCTHAMADLGDGILAIESISNIPVVCDRSAGRHE